MRHPNCKPIVSMNDEARRVTGITNKRAQHDEIERKTREFLAGGGEITVLDGYQDCGDRPCYFNYGPYQRGEA